jgi:uncharacterized membrane protein
MRSRWLSTFTLLGLLLIVLGVVGKIIGPRFVFDPGQIPDGNEAWYYMAVGALMLLNGLVLPALTAEEEREQKKRDKAASTKVMPIKTDARTNV